MILISIVLVAVATSLVAATPISTPNVVSLPVQKRAKSSHYFAKDVVARDKARIARHNERHAAPRGEEITPRTVGYATVTNDDVSYVAAVQICTVTYQLIIDTGSANIWAGGGPNKPSACGKASGGGYSSAGVTGTERSGPVTFAGLTASVQLFASVTSAEGYEGFDGVFGLGPVDLTEGTVSNLNTVPTWMDTLYSQGSISTEVLGVSFVPESGSDTDDANGEVTVGVIDGTRFTGSITYFAKSTTSPYSYYWGIDTVGLVYGSTSLGSSASAIVDTGTTLIYIPTTAYNKFLSAAGGKTDQNTGLAKFSTAPTSNFVINIGSSAFPLTPTQYLVPTAQYSYYGLSSGSYYSWINDGGPTAANVNFIIGQKFLEQYYAVFDTTHSSIGFAGSAL